ncbi:hypothetical protein ACFE04_031603 [Oxalis oulophora]
MEEVEQANEVAVESCHRLLNLISQSKHDQTHCRSLVSETGETVYRFKRVVSLLNNTLGHARVRKLKNLPNTNNIPHLPQNLLLDSPLKDNKQDNVPSQFVRSSFNENRAQLGSFAKTSLSLGSLAMDKSVDGKNHLQLARQTTPNPYLMLQQQQQNQNQNLQQRLQFHQQQQMKQQAEMMFRKLNNGINVNFDNSSCTPSQTRSLVSSLSLDGGSVANLNGSAFHLIGSDQSSQQHKRKCSARAEDGSVKCGSSARCHCSKKRKQRVKRSIKVPAISNKLADIPPDDYSWRKYGQKPIKGSPHPRYCQIPFRVISLQGET